MLRHRRANNEPGRRLQHLPVCVAIQTEPLLERQLRRSLLLREAEVRALQALMKGKLLGFDDNLIMQALGEVA